jgi:hypothetical protein
MSTDNPMTTLRSGLPFQLRHLDDNRNPDDHCVYLLPGHAQRFAMMHAIALIDHLEALAIRREMEQEERQRAAREARQRDAEASDQLIATSFKVARERAMLKAQIHPRQRRKQMDQVARLDAAFQILFGTQLEQGAA